MNAFTYGFTEELTKLGGAGKKALVAAGILGVGALGAGPAKKAFDEEVRKGALKAWGDALEKHDNRFSIKKEGGAGKRALVTAGILGGIGVGAHAIGRGKTREANKKHKEWKLQRELKAFRKKFRSEGPQKFREFVNKGHKDRIRQWADRQKNKMP